MYAVDTGSSHVLGIRREYNGQVMLGLYNFSPEYCRLEIESADWKDLAEPDREYIRSLFPTSEYWIEPYGFRWFCR